MMFRVLPVSTLALGILAFMFTFAEVRCSGKPLVEVPGTSLVLGGRAKTGPGMEEIQALARTFGSEETRQRLAPENFQLQPNPFAVGSVLAAMVAMVGVLARKRGRAPWLAMLFSAGAAGLVYLMRQDMLRRFDLALAENPSGFDLPGMLTLEFGAGFYGPLCLFALSLVLIVGGWLSERPTGESA